MKRLYFCRHGLSEMNKAGYFSGQTETPLAPEGRLQAEAAGDAALNFQIDFIISSPLSRAHDTAKIIATKIGYPHDKIALNNLLLERYLGDMEGAPYRDDIDLDSEEITGIEPYKALADRVQKALCFIHTLPDNNILVVSHGATGRMFRHVLAPTIPFWSPDAAVRTRNYFDNGTIVRLI